MSYINVDTDLIRNRKFKRFKRFLEKDDITAIGYLVLLWSNVLDLAEDGDITKWSKEDIAEYAGFNGEPDRFFKALNTNGFIDIRGDRTLLHDWWDNAGKYLTTKYRTHNIEKLEYIRSLYQTDQGLTKDIPQTDKIRLDKIRIDNINNFKEFISLYRDKVGRSLTKPELAEISSWWFRGMKCLDAVKEVLNRHKDKQSFAYYKTNIWRDYNELEGQIYKKEPLKLGEIMKGVS